MMDYDLSYQISAIQKEISQLRTEIIDLKSIGDDEIWDNNDLIRNWKVSTRTLATWRAEGLIEFVQVGSKIWHTKEHRDAFCQRNTSKINAD